MKIRRKTILAIAVSFISLVIIFDLSLPLIFSKRIATDIDKVNKEKAALVLGARAWSDTQPGAIFQARLDSAVALYEDNKAEKIIVSGDHGRKGYDEVNAGRVYLLSRGINKDDIFLDHAGFDTYDSIYRAKYIFGLDRFIIVSNDFHLPRALLISDSLGMHASAYESPWIGGGKYLSQIREIGARLKAFADILLSVKPKYLGDEIDISGSGLQTWDTLSP